VTVSVSIRTLLHGVSLIGYHYFIPFSCSLGVVNRRHGRCDLKISFKTHIKGNTQISIYFSVGVFLISEGSMINTATIAPTKEYCVYRLIPFYTHLSTSLLIAPYPFSLD
jgi:hypothetical protein